MKGIGTSEVGGGFALETGSNVGLIYRRKCFLELNTNAIFSARALRDPSLPAHLLRLAWFDISKRGRVDDEAKDSGATTAPSTESKERRRSTSDFKDWFSVFNSAFSFLRACDECSKCKEKDEDGVSQGFSAF